jgi:hypothetical protein
VPWKLQKRPKLGNTGVGPKLVVIFGEGEHPQPTRKLIFIRVILCHFISSDYKMADQICNLIGVPFQPYCINSFEIFVTIKGVSTPNLWGH